MRTNRIANLSLMIASISCAVILIGCQKHESNKVNPQTQVENLNGKSAAEVLQKKYSRAILNCNLYVQHTVEFLKTNPNDHFSVDLLEAQVPQNLQLSGSSDGLKLSAALTLQSLVSQSLQLDDAKGSTFRVQNSPTLPVKFDFTESIDDHEAVSTITTTIVEKIATAAISGSRAIGDDSVPYHELVECLLETDIKSQYADQFKTVKLGAK